MTSIFADAGYWIALQNPDDELHGKAKAVSATLGSVFLVTSEMVLTEYLNYFAGRGDRLRSMAGAWVQRMRGMPNIDIVPQTTELFRDAVALYVDRSDKGWSLTDCASFRIMSARGIVEALSHDKHFEQAGFKALLRGA
jgi:uncharacterized protein